MSKSMLLVAVLALVALCGSAAFALDPIGPPKAGVADGQFAVSVEYSNSDMDLDREVYYETTEHEVELDKFYVRLDYGITDNLGAFLRLGGAELDYEREASYVWKGDGGDVALGVGLRGTFYETEKLTLGGVVQYTWTEIDGDRESDYPEDGTFRTEIIEMQLAAGPTYTPTERVSIYGGPFLHFVRGHHATVTPNSNSHPLEEQSVFGGFAGVQVSITDNLSLSAEYMATGDADGFGVSAMWQF